MILRRITDAFRRQDWFTVFIETLIVVLGVYPQLIFKITDGAVVQSLAAITGN